MHTSMGSENIGRLMTGLGKAAASARGKMITYTAEQRNAALRIAAEELRRQCADILAANSRDLEAAAGKSLSSSMLDRLRLNADRVAAMAEGIEAIAALPDPLDKVLADWKRPNGLRIQRVSVPLGVIGIIYESRPNVTADAASLCLKSGNAVILRGGSESYHSSRAIHDCITAGLRGADIDESVVQMVPTTDRAAVGYLLSSMSDVLDVVVPRGGKRLIARVQQEARVPVIGHLEGLCHVYLHSAADPTMAEQIVVNAKLRRTGICGAAETLLVDAAAAQTLLPAVVGALQKGGCTIKGDDAVRALCPDVDIATTEDWSTEYLDAVIACRVVRDLDAAVEHIATFGSGHTDCIVTDDSAAAERFMARVDSAIVLHNASTQFADGGEFGMGAEIGIATGRIHARGPVGAEQLTSYKYLVRGNGQVRA